MSGLGSLNRPNGSPDAFGCPGSELLGYYPMPLRRKRGRRAVTVYINFRSWTGSGKSFFLAGLGRSRRDHEEQNADPRSVASRACLFWYLADSMDRHRKSDRKTGRGGMQTSLQQPALLVSMAQGMFFMSGSNSGKMVLGREPVHHRPPQVNPAADLHFWAAKRVLLELASTEMGQ